MNQSRSAVPVPPAPAVIPSHIPATERVQSLDALRGFDMFWISGGEEFFHTLAAASAWGWSVAFAQQLAHSRWAGFTCYDLIQPLFLFVTGLTLPLMISRRLAAGKSRTDVFNRLLIRALWLIVLGHLDKNGPISLDFASQRFTGVLNRIGVAALVAGVIIMFARPRAQVLWIVGILSGYWALLTFVSAPGQSGPSFAQGVNIVDYLDQQIMPGRLADGNHDANGWASTPPVIATVLFGALAGQWLLSTRTDSRKLVGLLAAGVALIGLGWIWSWQFPIIKHLWTSSFVLYTAGWSCLLLAGFHAVIDVLKWRTWAFPFLLIGMNPLLIYLLRNTRLVDFPRVAKFIFGFTYEWAGPAWAPVLASVAILLVELLILHWLYRRRLFWRV